MSEKLQKLNQSLKDAGYIWLSVDEAVSGSNPYDVYRWYGPKGIVIVLHNEESQCLETFADWPLGVTFDSFEQEL